MSSPVSTDPPELAGPGTYDASGGVGYGIPGPQSGPIPGRLSPAERERELAAAEQLIGSCQCRAIPGGLLIQLQQLARYAPAHPDGSGCPRCRPIPAALIAQLAGAITTGVAA